MLTLQPRNCFAESLGDRALSLAQLSSDGPQMAAYTRRLSASAGSGMEAWRHLPLAPMRQQQEEVRVLADRLRPSTRHLLVLGIGGSSLGTTALHQALNPPTWNQLDCEHRDGPTLHVLDNPDPRTLRHVIHLHEHVDPGWNETLLVVVSRSGSTAETAALFLILRDHLRDALGDDHARRIVAITSASGSLRRICEEQQYASLSIPEGVGGRFSVLSPVGLFPAAMCGIDTDGLLDGAAEMDVLCRNEDMTNNPAAMLAWILVRSFEQGRTSHVLMPYHDALDELGAWYRQLWAESLGKDRTLAGEPVVSGPTPIAARGPADQHSQLQLYLEGPPDKIIGFVTIDDPEPDFTIPCSIEDPELSYLQGASLRKLVDAEQRATAYALLEKARPSYSIQLERLDAHHVGGFIWMWQMATAYAGLLLDIDPYNQPAVETGKQAARRFLEEGDCKG